MIPLGVLASARVAPAVSYRAAVLADSPSWYYPLDELASPAVDAVSLGTKASTGSVTFGATGLGAGATSVDFSGGRIVIGTSPSSFSSFTIEALISRDVNGAYLMIVEKETAAFDIRDYRFALNPSNNKVEFTSSNAVQVFSTTSPSVDVAYHVAVVVDSSAGNAKIYVNGALETTGTGITTTNTSTSHSIGAQHDGGLPFNGKIAGVAFYTTALSAGRILAHAQAAGKA